ncbi:DNA gyrase subunit A [Rhodospirillales bacterium TMPK1]|uniref:DNA gyrase subunit A n=2 Tax=Roseiterribacter gracilis TaxID=2812848 RepID=A0A8S8XB78_9PROT|nr:DNA gyrase subunit A [Rhodospirillales bacterium TMPK1]
MTDQNNTGGPPSDGPGKSAPQFDIQPIAIEDEMKRSYLDYAMSVIVARALPDVRDGLKPVHRRILHAMREGGYDSSKSYKKSARIVGDVMGKYHPHGDSAIYDAMVRMAQDFSMRLPLIDGQGNFGSMDGDPPAAMRYTEARLAKSAEALLEDIDKDTVTFGPNYDDTMEEPLVLPARYPNLLVNGAGGIAVGMATNIPTHNLGEVVDACCMYLDDRTVGIDELMTVIPGPDFPTGGLIIGKAGVRSALHTGHGSVMMRSRTSIEEIRKDREAIIVTEIPYQVNKSRLVERIAEVVNLKIVEGISELRDESDRDGVRVVIELKRDAVADVVLNNLFKHTPLQTSFGVNMLALDHGRPKMLNLKDVIRAFVEFREEVITRRTVFELNAARARAHILVGLALAVANIDEMIETIRRAPDPASAREAMLARTWPVMDIGPLIELIDEPGRVVEEGGVYRLSEEQAKAILELRLQRLTGLEREKIANELQEVVDKIAEYLGILSDRDKLIDILRNELLAAKAQFGTPRRTELVESEFEQDIEALIQREDMVVTVSHGGYVKRTQLSAYRAQKRGGKGRSGMATKDEDFVSRLFAANTHTPMLFFTTKGIVYKLKVWQLPLGNPQSRGKAFVNLLPLAQGEGISAVMPLPEDEASWENLFVMFATSMGTVRRNRLSDFQNIRSNGLIAMKLEEGERLIEVRTCSDDNDILLATRAGRCIRFEVPEVRVFAGRTSTGVRGIKLAKDDEVISMSVLRHVDASPDERAAYLKQANALRRATGEAAAIEEPTDSDEEGAIGEASLSAERFIELQANEEFLLTVTDRGFGKRTSAYEYRVTGRGGQGIENMRFGEKSRAVAATFPAGETDQVMLVTDGGQIIRMPLHDVRVAGRRTMGVTLFRVSADEHVVSVAHLEESPGADDDVDSDTDGDIGDSGSNDSGETLQ